MFVIYIYIYNQRDCEIRLRHASGASAQAKSLASKMSHKFCSVSVTIALEVYLFGATLTSYKTPDGVERSLT